MSRKRLPCACKHWDKVYLGAFTELSKAAKHSHLSLSLSRRGSATSSNSAKSPLTHQIAE